MNILLDIIGATLIGGVILFMVINLNIYSSTVKYSSDSELKLQQNAKTLAEIINHDLRKIGYRVNGTAVQTADSNRFTFLSDIDRNGSTDVITYVLGNPSSSTTTINPNDRLLYRIVNSDTMLGASLGLVNAKFSYKKADHTFTNTPDSIRYIRAELWVQTTEPIDSNYSFTYWEMTVSPRNI